jgi:hypothetical protein
MTPLQTRIIDELKTRGLYATKGINAILPELIEESIYTARELGVDYFTTHTSFSKTIQNIVIKESAKWEVLRIKKELQKNSMALFHSDRPYTEIDDKVRMDLIKKLETAQGFCD